MLNMEEILYLIYDIVFRNDFNYTVLILWFSLLYVEIYSDL